MTKQLDLYMNNILVGKLTKHSHGELSFTYHSLWLEKPGTRPVSLSLPLIDTSYQGDVVQNFFDNLLTDNPRIKERIQRLFHIKSAQPFDLLAEIGKDCVGAIQLVQQAPKSIKTIETKPLTDKHIASLLKHYHTAPLGMSQNETEFRLSIPGAQEKSSFLFYKNKWRLPIATTPSSHIFKLPIGIIEHQNMGLSDSCENEWLCSNIIKLFGLPVADAEIRYFEDAKILVVKRFDRQWSSDQTWLMRLPQEDCCQALGYPPALKYEADGGPGIKEIMNLLLGSKQPQEDRETFFRSQVVFFLLAAIDGHAKNFSVFIESGGHYRLTPLYDIMSAYPLIEKKQLQNQKIKMAMGLVSKNKHYHWHTIQRRHFISTAKATNFSTIKAEQIIDEVVEQIDQVITEATAMLPSDFPKAIASSIFNGMKQAKKRLIQKKPVD